MARKGPNRRQARLGDLLIEEISQLLVRGIKDPRVDGVTLTGCEVSRDGRDAKVFFTTHAGEESRPAEALTGLESAAGFIRRHLAQNLDLRHIPNILFRYDDSFDRAIRIETILHDLRESPEGDEDATS